MKRIFKNCHLPQNLEVLCLLTLGILLQMADGSPFSLKERWMLVWETELPAENFSVFVQKFIKTLLSVIVVVRCATTYAYVVSAMLVIFCLLKNTAPKLMLLWLLVAGVKSVFMTLLEALAGVYVCSAFGKIRKACIEFFISKALEIIFAAYLWGNVLNIYQELERKAESEKTASTKEHMYVQKVDFGRQRARSLVDESTLYKTACLNNFEFKDVPQIILQMLRKGDEMSQDSLLGQGMMLASVSNLGSFDNLKTSQSLGELGFMDLAATQVIGLEEDENISHQEKALRFLKLTRSDVTKIQMNKSRLDNDIYTIDKDTWARVASSGSHISKPKQARTQVFIHDMHQLESCVETNVKSKIRKKSFDYKFGFSFSNLFYEKQTAYDDEQEDEVIFSHDEDEDEEDDDDEKSVQLFMSNLKEGVIISPNRLGIVLKKTKGNAYAELYRQDFMNTIGPEVFDRASKLQKVTSLTKINSEFEASPVLIPDLEPQKETIQILESESREPRISPTSSEYVQQPEEEKEGKKEKEEEKGEQEEQDQEREDFGVTESSSGEKIKVSLETDLREDEADFVPESTCDLKVEADKSEICEEIGIREPYIKGNNEDREDTQPKACFQKRRIIIRRIGKRKESCNSSSESEQNSENFYSSLDTKPKTDLKKNSETREKSKNLETKFKSHLGKDSSSQTPFPGYNKQIYFIKELFQKPLLDVLLTYYYLKWQVQKHPVAFYKKTKKEFFNIPLQSHQLRNYDNILQSLDFGPDDSKVWKSKVLKTAEARRRENSIVNQTNLSNVVKRESIVRRILKYEWARMTYKNRNSFESFENFFWHISAKDPDFLNTGVSSLKSDTVHTTKLESEICLNGDSEIAGTCSSEERHVIVEEQPEVESIRTDSHETQNWNTEAENILYETIETDSRVVESDYDAESICSQESDEPISLYYSKAANLASPLFDMKRFIYPDHIHYSYKHVKKKGFDVDINGGFPLLMRESLTMGAPVKMGSKPISKNPEFEITRRPMDLSFATTNAFAEWQNNEQDVVIPEKRIQNRNNSSGKKQRNPSVVDFNKSKKAKKTKRKETRSSSKIDFKKSNEGSFNNIKYLYSTKDYALIEKLLKMHMQFNNDTLEDMGRKRQPIQISSTQLHSNKGRISSTYNPAIFLQENKNRTEKKKIETQEERTKDMFARLEREALLQNKNVQKTGRNS